MMFSFAQVYNLEIYYTPKHQHRQDRNSMNCKPVREFADRIVLMSAGTVIAIAGPSELEHCATLTATD
jgi:hypothetical protein